MIHVVTITKPELQRLPLAPWAANPIHDLLDAVGLPWRESSGELESRVGVSDHPVFAETVLMFPDAYLVPGLLWPITTGAWRTPPNGRRADLPKVSFAGYVWLSGDAQGNIERTAASLAERLGPATIERDGNVLGGGWAAGPAAIRLMVFPPEWQEPGGYNIYTAREPRYREACSVSIHTGFRPPLTDEERGWIDGFTAIGTLHGGATTEEQLRDTPAVEYALEYVREPPARAAHLLRRIGHAPERRALIFCAEQLFVVPAAEIVEFRADRMQPAKGSGGSSLVVECHRPGHAGNPTTIRFDSGPGPDDMNGLCIECGQLFDKPALLGEYYPDD
jgi:hypothetical protein